MLNRLYCFMHKQAKRILKQNNDVIGYKMVDLGDSDFDSNGYLKADIRNSEINEYSDMEKMNRSCVFPTENLVSDNIAASFTESFQKKRKERSKHCQSVEQAVPLWKEFIKSSVIPGGYRNAGLSYAGFINECSSWCLPSWVWTNAAQVRYYCEAGDIEKAERLGNILLSLQDKSGGWVVRNDYSREGVIPQLAPNDSAYIANNAFVELYKATGNEDYLDAAKRCADWIIETARPDGFVWLGYDMKRKCWIKENNIVDTGFTAGLFARLYEVTNKNEYHEFLKRFTDKYIELFYNKEKGLFATGIDKNDKQQGGTFGRGQAWALEGLIPAYEVLKTDGLKKVIDTVVKNLIRLQGKTGGWSYNFDKPLMGEDCKAVSVIAYSLLRWRRYASAAEINTSIVKALDWCAAHTCMTGEGRGGIYSFTMEGAIVHHLYTSTAFVYSSAYTLEVYKLVKGDIV